MPDDLSIRGELTDATVPELLRSIVRSADSAILTVDDGPYAASIYFDTGNIVFASSSDPDLSLHNLLLRDGVIDLEQHGMVPPSAVIAGRVGASLTELGILDGDALIRGLERQVREIVHGTLLIRSGAYVVEFVEGLPLHVTPLKLGTETMLLDGMRAIQRWSLIERGLGRMDRVLRQSQGAALRADSFDLAPDESHIFETLATPQTIETLCMRSYLSDFLTCRVVWALVTIGLLEDAAGEVLEQRDAEEAEYEMERRVERYNTLFQTIFGIVFQRIGDHIYDFADRVVLQLSPAIVPYLSGVSFVNEGRVDFDQLLNNIISSGSKDQSLTVETVLSELLYGWILEIRKEFGPELESEIVVLAQSLKDA